MMKVKINGRTCERIHWENNPKRWAHALRNSEQKKCWFFSSPAVFRLLINRQSVSKSEKAALEHILTTRTREEWSSRRGVFRQHPFWWSNPPRFLSAINHDDGKSKIKISTGFLLLGVSKAIEHVHFGCKCSKCICVKTWRRRKLRLPRSVCDQNVRFTDKEISFEIIS